MKVGVVKIDLGAMQGKGINNADDLIKEVARQVAELMIGQISAKEEKRDITSADAKMCIDFLANHVGYEGVLRMAIDAKLHRNKPISAEVNSAIVSEFKTLLEAAERHYREAGKK